MILPGKSNYDVQVRYNSASHERTLSNSLTYANRNFAGTTVISASGYSDLRSGKLRSTNYEGFGARSEYVLSENGVDQIVQNNDPHIQRFSGYSQWSVMNKMKFRVGDYAYLEHLLLHSTTGNIPRYDKLTEREDNDTLRFAEWFYGPQVWHLQKIGFHSHKRSLLYDNLVLASSYQFFLQKVEIVEKVNETALFERKEECVTWGQ